MDAVVVAVSRNNLHAPGKHQVRSIRLIEGFGVEGDAHGGETVQHRSRVARDPLQPNRRQVHLIHAELHDELRANGFDLAPGEMGENITTRGVDLLALPAGTVLRFGSGGAVVVTGLRNPCRQLDDVRPGLMAATVDLAPGPRGPEVVRRKAGVMAVVLQGGDVAAGDVVTVEEAPGGSHLALV